MKATVIKKAGEVICVSLARRNGEEILLSWTHINMMLKAITDAPLYEYFPAFAHVVDHANERHFWRVGVEPDFDMLADPSLEVSHYIDHWNGTFQLISKETFQRICIDNAP
jgi:hypothetical protein